MIDIDIDIRVFCGSLTSLSSISVCKFKFNKALSILVQAQVSEAVHVSRILF